jgi:putative endonuclease
MEEQKRSPYFKKDGSNSSGHNFKTGIVGESLAESFLKNKGYEIIATNFFTKMGEIDLIAKHNGCIVFIEVKARNSFKYGRPAEAVTYFKQNKIRQVATLFLMQKKLYPCQMRFDVIEIMGGEILSHIENAF